MRGWKIAIAAVLVLGAGWITAAGLRDRPPPALEVQLGKVRKGTIVRTVTGGGKVQAATTVKISSNISGDLVELAVKAGDRVRRGQVLGRLDRRRFEAAARQASAGQSAARAEVAVAQVEADRAAAEHARVEGLAGKEMMSVAELERARADRDGALARLAAAKERYSQAGALYEEAANNLSKTTLYSPIEGNVIEVSREVGERVRGSDFNEDVVMTIAALSAMEVKLEVGEHEVVHLEMGQKAEVRLDALEGQLFEGMVAEIAQKANVKNPGTDAEVTTFPVTVALATRPPAMLPGMNAEVRIAAATRKDALIVPIQAVTVRSEKSLPDAKVAVETGTALTAARRAEALARVVFVVDDRRLAHPRRVKTGISSDTEYEVLEGLSEGETIAEGPYRTLAKDIKDGDSVREVEAKGKPAPRI